MQKNIGDRALTEMIFFVEKDHLIDMGWQRSAGVIIDLALGGFTAQPEIIGS